MRFPEFSGEWNKIKVRDFAKVVAGATPSTGNKEYWGGDIRWMNSGELNLKRVYEVQGRITQLGYDKSSTKLIPPQSVLIGLAGQGKTRGTAAINYVELCTNQSIASILPSETFYPEFIYQNIESRYTELRDISSGDGGRGGLNLQMIYNLDIPHCSLTEQKKIGDFLYLLDERIEIQNKVIEKLKSSMKRLNDKLMDNPKWEKAYIGDFMDFYSTNSLSWEQLNYEDGQIKNLHYGLIHVGLPTIVDCNKTPLPYIQDSCIPSKYNTCKNGDVAFADASEDTTEVGKAVELDNIGNLNIVCGLHTIHGRDVKNKTICGFKGFAFNSKYFHDQVRRIAQGSKVFSINADSIKTCYLYIPNFEEQQKIVALLRCMQETIKVEEQALHIYETQKHYLLQHMFI